MGRRAQSRVRLRNAVPVSETVLRSCEVELGSQTVGVEELLGGVGEPCGPGASRGEKDLAPLPRAAAVQEHCERPAEVRHGERQDRATVGHGSALPGKLCPPSPGSKVLRDLRASSFNDRSAKSMTTL